MKDQNQFWEEGQAPSVQNFLFEMMFFKLCKYLVWVFDAGIWVSFLYCVIWANKEIGLQRSLTWIGLFAVEARWSHLPRLGQSRACKVAGVCLLFPAWGPCPDAIQVSHPCGANLLRQWKKKKGALSWALGDLGFNPAAFRLMTLETRFLPSRPAILQLCDSSGDSELYVCKNLGQS